MALNTGNSGAPGLAKFQWSVRSSGNSIKSQTRNVDSVSNPLKPYAGWKNETGIRHNVRTSASVTGGYNTASTGTNKRSATNRHGMPAGWCVTESAFAGTTSNPVGERFYSVGPDGVDSANQKRYDQAKGLVSGGDISVP